MVYAERIMPNSQEAEEGVIGSLLLDPEATAKLAGTLRAEDFFTEATRWCYEACVALQGRGEVVDQLTVADELARRGWLADVGGHSYLGSLIAALPTSLHAEQYADIVRRMALLRGLINAASEIAAMGHESPVDVLRALDAADVLIGKLRERAVTNGITTLRDVMDKFLAEMSGAVYDGPLTLGTAPIPTGLMDIDQLLGGLHRSDLVIVAARPSVGKTALAVTIARNAAAQGARVGLVSLEMSNEDIGNRLLASETGVDTHRLRLHLYSAEEEQRLTQAVGRLSDLVVYMEDTAQQTIKGIAAWARKVRERQPLDLLIVDYLQLIKAGNDRPDQRVAEVSQISRDLKLLAKSLNVPVLACSQMNRQVEGRSSHRPMLSDLRESGSIEQDADIVLFIHREDLWVTEQEWELRVPDQPYPKDVAEIIVAKHRHGPVGSVWLRFNPKLARFEDSLSDYTDRETGEIRG